MRDLIRRVSVALLFVISAGAHAQFETRDSAFGANTLIRDYSTGLEWLRLDVTMGQSYDSVLSNLEAGGLYEGFRFASRDAEPQSLLEAAGFRNWFSQNRMEPRSQAELDTGRAFLAMFGGGGDALYGAGYYGPAYASGGNIMHQPINAHISPEGAMYFDSEAIFYKPQPYNFVGAYLISVAPIPEPETYALMAVGLLLLGAHVRSARNRPRVG